jgi:hypothetical protein
MTKNGNKRTRKPVDVETVPKQGVVDMQDPMAEIAARAEGGKVAVIERGAKEAKVLDLKGNGTKDKPSALEAHQIELTPDAKESIQQALSALQNCDIQQARLRQSYLAQEKSLMDHRENLDRELTALIKSQGRRFKVPEHYVLNLDTMSFVPAPPRSMMGPQRTS